MFDHSFLMNALFPVDETSVKENKVNSYCMWSLLLYLKPFECDGCGGTPAISTL